MSGELAVLGAFTALGLAATATAPGYGILLDGGRVGPGLLPLVAGALVALLCGASLVQAARGRAETAVGRPDADDRDIFGRTARQRMRILWTVFTLMTITVLLVDALGFLVAFGLFLVVVSSFVERRPLRSSILISATALVVAYAVFVRLLQVPLPGWPSA